MKKDKNEIKSQSIDPITLSMILIWVIEAIVQFFAMIGMGYLWQKIKNWFSKKKIDNSEEKK